MVAVHICVVKEQTCLNSNELQLHSSGKAPLENPISRAKSTIHFTRKGVTSEIQMQQPNHRGLRERVSRLSHPFRFSTMPHKAIQSEKCYTLLQLYQHLSKRGLIHSSIHLWQAGMVSHLIIILAGGRIQGSYQDRTMGYSSVGGIGGRDLRGCRAHAVPRAAC